MRLLLLLSPPADKILAVSYFRSLLNSSVSLDHGSLVLVSHIGSHWSVKCTLFRLMLVNSFQQARNLLLSPRGRHDTRHHVLQARNGLFCESSVTIDQSSLVLVSHIGSHGQ